MKRLLLLMTIVTFVSCNQKNDDEFNFVDLDIIKTETPKTVSLGQPVVSRITVSGPNLCYRFRRTNIASEAGNRYVVRAIGTFPEGDPVCAQAVYTEVVSVDITPSVKGTYYLDFQQYDRHIKTDTVVVQ